MQGCKKDARLYTGECAWRCPRRAHHLIEQILRPGTKTPGAGACSGEPRGGPAVFGRRGTRFTPALSLLHPWEGFSARTKRGGFLRQWKAASRVLSNLLEEGRKSIASGWVLRFTACGL